MVEKVLDVTREQMLSELIALIPSGEPPGEGWYTIAEIAEASGEPIGRVKFIYSKLAQADKVDKWKGGSPPKVYYKVKHD